MSSRKDAVDIGMCTLGEAAEMGVHDAAGDGEWVYCVNNVYNSLVALSNDTRMERSILRVFVAYLNTRLESSHTRWWLHEKWIIDRDIISDEQTRKAFSSLMSDG